MSKATIGKTKTTTRLGLSGPQSIHYDPVNQFPQQSD